MIIPFLNRSIRFILLLVIRIYQYLLSPLLGSCCRFIPTCSEYGIIALKKHGPLRGSWLTIKRLFRCHPWGNHGQDLVP